MDGGLISRRWKMEQEGRGRENLLCLQYARNLEDGVPDAKTGMDRLLPPPPSILGLVGFAAGCLQRRRRKRRVRQPRCRNEEKHSASQGQKKLDSGRTRNELEEEEGEKLDFFALWRERGEEGSRGGVGGKTLQVSFFPFPREWDRWKKEVF